MAIPVSVIVWAVISFSGGGVLGALSRQPEINKLKEQVRKLQAEVKRLNSLISEQNRQIQALRMKYEVLMGKTMIEAAKVKGQLKGAIMYSYCLKEYLDINYKIISTNSEKDTTNYTLSKQEYAFYEGFGQVLRGVRADERQEKIKRYFIREYIRERYGAEIDNLIECDLSMSINRIGGLSS